jgi:hypothetical protein
VLFYLILFYLPGKSNALPNIIIYQSVITSFLFSFILQSNEASLEMGDETHSAEDCPFKKQLAELEEEHNRMSKNLHMSAVYGTSLLEENKSLKLQIKETQASQEVNTTPNE